MTGEIIMAAWHQGGCTIDSILEFVDPFVQQSLGILAQVILKNPSLNLHTIMIRSAALSQARVQCAPTRATLMWARGLGQSVRQQRERC